MSLASDFAMAMDPARFMASSGFAPDAWQRDFVRSTAPRHLLLCARQLGKSTVTAALATHTALYHAGALVLILAPSFQQSAELFRKVTGFYRLAATPEPDAESMRRVELPNTSRIVCLSGNPTTVRGFSAPRLIIVDEACFADDELFASITPMLAGGGRLVLLSTPNGRQGYFFEAWENGGATWARTRVTANMSPRIPPAFLETERATMSDRDFRRDFLCEFVGLDEQLFASDLIDRAFRAPVAPLFPQPFTWAAPAGRAA